jgi:hypothetical protein
MSWLSLLPDLSDSVDVIGKLAENVKKAVEVGKSIYGEAQQGRLKNSLTKIRNSMMNTNSKKSKVYAI